MKKFNKTLLIIGLVSLFITITGCQEKEITKTSNNIGSNSSQSGPSNSDTAADTPRVIKTSGKVELVGTDKPTIEFEELVHDFGVIPVKTPVNCEFKFKNTGNATLKFTRKPKAQCGCTVVKLDKMEYAPGESGSIKVNYRGELSPMRINKHIDVYSNDTDNPDVRLAIKAEIQIQIVADPEVLKFKLDEENGGAGPITISSRDGKEFAITGFESTGSAITADFDSTKKADKHTIKPNVDIAKLEKVLNGNITINIDHPSTKQMLLSYSTLPWNRLSSTRITLLNPIPGKAETREIMVLSNYGQEVEIESTSSAKNCIKVLSQEKRGNSVKLVVEVTPEQKQKNTFGFYDYLTINFKKGDKLTIVASGMFRTKSQDKKTTINVSN
ncbi:MAG: DUF1573 domain-containing protein [Phycisphaerae bacterium]|nr:DUF1573 domain-containing protein [Phycisphaerae bacterium]